VFYGCPIKRRGSHFESQGKRNFINEVIKRGTHLPRKDDSAIPTTINAVNFLNREDNLRQVYNP